MDRISTIKTAADYPGTPDKDTRKGLADLFAYLFPDRQDGEIDEAHAGIAIAAHNPALARHLAELSRFIALDLPWSHRTDLRELAIQTVNAHFGSGYSFKVRQPVAEAAGISAEQQDSLLAGTIGEFDGEQELVVAYSRAVAGGKVPDELFSRVVDKYGEKGAVEFTTVVAFWSFWAMFLNATMGEASDTES